MKRFLAGPLIVIFFLTLTATVHAKQHIYKWVKDKGVSSQDVLTASQGTRVVPLAESQTLDVVRQVMTGDLFLALAEYHKSKHQQDAETTPDSVLPEQVIGQAEVELGDEDYLFSLEVRLKSYADRTRLIVNAHPVYRIHDVDAEEEANSETAENTVEVKVKAGRNQAVSMGPVYIEPALGVPADYEIQPLPDAAERCAKLVRSFMYLLDQRIKK